MPMAPQKSQMELQSWWLLPLCKLVLHKLQLELT